MNRQHLGTLHTPLGNRSLYDSVCFCNRCGMCASVCPAYQNTPQENNSPRGRNQALRGVLEGKLKPKQVRTELLELLTSCTLCGRCQAVCPGQIPTAQHVLELRRTLQARLLPTLLFKLLRLRGTAPRLFSFLVSAGLWMRRLQGWSVLMYLPGFAWLKHLNKLLPARTPHPFQALSQTRPTFIYLPSLEAQFFLPDIAQSAYQLLTKKHRVAVWENTACGLFEFVYGDLSRARRQLRALITRHQKTGKAKLPLVTDSIDVYHFLTQAPQLFEGYPTWQQKAQNLAACTHYIADYLPKNPAALKTISNPVLLMTSALFNNQSSAQEKSAQILRSLFKKNLVECGYKEPQAVPAGYGFIKGSRANAYNLQAVRTVARQQVQTVVVLSGFAALELGLSLRQFYPTARVCHIAKLNG